MSGLSAHLSVHHIEELVRELTGLVRGLRVREVQAHPPRDLLLILDDAEGGGPIRRVRLSAAPDGARCHLQIGPVKRHDGPVGPFFRAVAAELEGTVLREIAQVAGDRIVRLECKPADGPPRTLIGELFARHPNLLLLDARGFVKATLVAPAEGSSAADRAALGATYAPPPRRGARRVGEAREEAREAPTSIADDFPDPEDAPLDASAHLVEIAPLSWRVESALGSIADTRFDERRRKDLAGRLEQRLKSARNRLAGLELQAAGTARAERVREDAELVTAHLARLKRGDDRLEVDDPYAPDDDGETASPPRRLIELDPALSPRRNAERLFARYKKLVRSAEKLPAELDLARAAIDGLEELLGRLEEESPSAVEEEAVARALLPPRQEAPARKHARVEKRLPYHRFVGAKGGEIRVGRTARDNDTLTFKHARGNDLWLHTSDSPGSHVVLVVERGKEPEPEDVLDAAHLAIHYSPLRGAAKAGVHVCHQKEVRKPKRAPAGLVTLSGGRTRMIRVERDRLERLLDARRAPRGGE